MNIKSVFIGLILVIVAFIFVIQVVPTIEAVDTDNITNSTTKAIAKMGVWVIPVLAICGVFYGAFRLIKHRRDE